jgi:hypothetical protein
MRADEPGISPSRSFAGLKAPDYEGSTLADPLTSVALTDAAPMNAAVLGQSVRMVEIDEQSQCCGILGLS